MVNLIGSAIENIGYKLGLPEWNISEKFGVHTPSMAKPGSEMVFNAQYGFNPTQEQQQKIATNAFQTVDPNYNNPSPSYSGGTPSAPTIDPNAPQSGWGREFSNMDEYNRFRDSQTSAINSAYGNIFGRLDQMANILPQQQAEDEGFLTDKYNAIQSGISTAKQGALDKLGNQVTQVKTQGREGAAKVAEDLRNMLRASQMQIGAMGGGSSSASDVMLPYAMSKQAAKASGQVQRGVNDNLFNIEQKKLDVQTTFDTQIKELDQWKVDSQMQIKDKYRQLLTNIDMQKNTADERKMQALSAMETNIMGMAQQELMMLEQNALNTQNAIREWAMNRYAQLQDNQAALGTAGQYNPAALTWDAIQGVSGMMGRQGSDMVNLGYSFGKRQDENTPTV